MIVQSKSHLQWFFQHCFKRFASSSSTPTQSLHHQHDHSLPLTHRSPSGQRSGNNSSPPPPPSPNPSTPQSTSKSTNTPWPLPSQISRDFPISDHLKGHYTYTSEERAFTSCRVYDELFLWAQAFPTQPGPPGPPPDPSPPLTNIVTHNTDVTQAYIEGTQIAPFSYADGAATISGLADFACEKTLVQGFTFWVTDAGGRQAAVGVVTTPHLAEGAGLGVDGEGEGVGEGDGLRCQCQGPGQGTGESVQSSSL